MQIEPSLNSSTRSTRSKKKKQDITIVRNRMQSSAKSCSQDVVESCQASVIIESQSRLVKNSPTNDGGRRTVEILEPESSKVSQMRGDSNHVPESRLGLERKDSDDFNERLKTRPKKKGKLKFPLDSKTDSDPNDRITENENPNNQKWVQILDSDLDKCRKKSKLKGKRRSSWDKSLTESVPPIEEKQDCEAKVLNDSLEHGNMRETEKSSAERTSSPKPQNSSVKDVKRAFRKVRKLEANKKLGNKRSDTLRDWILNTSSSSNSHHNERTIDNNSIEFPDRGDLSERTRSRISEVFMTTDEEEGNLVSNTKSVENIRKKNNIRSPEHEETMKSENSPADASSNCDSPNIFNKDSEIETVALQKDESRREEGVKKKRSNTLLAIIDNNTSDSDSDDEKKKIVNKRKPANLKRTKYRGTITPDTKSVGNSVSSAKVDKTLEDCLFNNHKRDEKCSKNSLQSPEQGKSIKSENSSADTVSDYGSPTTSVKDLETKPQSFEEDRKPNLDEKVRRKKSNTLLATIHDSTSNSDSDYEKRKITNKRKLGNRNKIKHRKTIKISNEERENQTSDVKYARNFISKGKKKLDDSRSEDHKRDEKCLQNNRQTPEHEMMIKSEKLLADRASKRSSPKMSVLGIKTEPEALEQESEREAKKPVAKMKSNSFLSMIHDSADSSDSDNEKNNINNSFEELLNKTNLRKKSKYRVSETFTASSESDKEQSSNTKFDNNSKFGLEVEAQDVEEMISSVEEENQVPRETMQRLHSLRVTLKHTVPPQHQIETCAGSRGPTPEQKKLFERYGPIKYGKFTPEEDDIIVRNWKSFCKMHDWDSRDVKPFLYMRHRKVGFVTKFAERQKFVQFLADGLPWRTLYSVYWRFRNLYQPHLQTRYNGDEDKLILAHMENSSAIGTKNVRKFSELAKILNRTRASVWRRYRLLKRKKKPDSKVEWNLHLVEKLIKNLMVLTLSDDVKQLKDQDIPLVVWKKLSKKFKIDDADLKQFWLCKLHMQLFCDEPIYLNDVKIKLIEYFYVKGISEWWEIDWAEIAKHFDGMTSIFLCQRFSSMIYDKNFEGMELSEILEHLYRNKKPQLQQAPTDKFLQRLVFKDQKVVPLDIEEDNQSSDET